MPGGLYVVQSRVCKILRMSALALVMACGVTACKQQEAALSRVPGIGVTERAQGPSETTLFLPIPIDVSAIRDAAENALGERVAKWRAFIEDIACDKRKGPWTECIGAVVSTEIVRAGAVNIVAEGGRLLLVIPLKYDIAAKGHGWASYLSDQKAGRVDVRIPIEASIGAGYRLDARITGEPIWSEKAISVLKGKIALGQSGDAKLKADLKAAADPIRKALADQPLKASVERAWRSLHTPLVLMRGPDLWLRGEPLRVLGGGFDVENGSIVYRIGIGARATVLQGERPSPLIVKPLPEPARQIEAAARTRLLFPVDFSSSALLAALQSAFPVNETIETKADNKAQAVKVTTRGVALHPSKDLFAIELKFDVVEPRRMLGQLGTAYFTARPVMRAETGIMELDEIGFPAAPKDGKSPRTDIIRIGEEPFAGRIATAGQLAIGDTIRALLPRMNASVEQQLDDALAVGGQFEALNVVSIEPKRDALRVNLELQGALTLTLSGPVVRAGQMQRTDATVSPLALPAERR